MIDNPIITKIVGNANFHIKSKSKIFWHPKSKATPISNPIKFPVFSLSLNSTIKHGTIMNNVHHPSKNILIFVIPSAFPPIIKPIIIKTIPHNTFPNFFIIYLPPFYLIPIYCLDFLLIALMLEIHKIVNLVFGYLLI